MPVARSIGQRIAAGTLSAASLTSTYDITALPVQSDQGLSIPWVLSAQLCGTPTPARITTNADLSRSADGFLSTRWGFRYLTFNMFEYWNDTFLPGGAWSAPVTILDYTDDNTPIYMTGTIWRPVAPSDKAGYITGGWSPVIYEIQRGVQIFP